MAFLKGKFGLGWILELVWKFVLAYCFQMKIWELEQGDRSYNSHMLFYIGICISQSIFFSFCHYCVLKIFNLLFLISFIFTWVSSMLISFHIGTLMKTCSVFFHWNFHWVNCRFIYRCNRQTFCEPFVQFAPVLTSWKLIITILYPGYFHCYNPPVLFRFHQFCMYSVVCVECVFSSVQFSNMHRVVKILNSHHH